MRKLHLAVGFALSALALVVACGSSTDSVFGDPVAHDSGNTSSSGDPPILGGSSGGDGAVDPAAEAFTIAPVDPVVTFSSGQAAPTVQFKAVTASGGEVPASFTIDRGEIGSVGLTTGLFTASGAVGGKATITATRNGKTASTTVTVKLAMTDNGLAAADAGADGGAGGYGGVGGEGPGGPVSAATVAVLKGAPVDDPGLSFLYPYDKTVWPRGILAPLLQWAPGAQGDYDAVYVKLSEAAFQYEGFFAKTGATFVHHPIPQQAWKQLLASNAGEEATLTLVFAKGNVAYGPITRKWKIASAPLKGIVYYNSYGTRLAKNYGGAKGPGDGKFGGATLAIKGGSTDPELVAGGTGDSSQCRVCHSVSANGAVLITQRDLGDQKKFSAYDLKTGAETVLSPEGDTAKFAWPAIYPDGSMFLGDSSSAAGSSTTPNGLFTVPTGPTGTPTTITTNWPAGFSGAYPSFSPDGKKLAFTMFQGQPGADKKTLGMMTFDKATKQFGALTALHTPAGGTTALFPSFLPTNDAIVFERETRFNAHDYGGTRSDADVSPPAARADVGAHGELWWLDLKTNPPTAFPLNNLNGKDATGSRYIPAGSQKHDDDTTLNYEPTVNPVPSGGYAWVVFTSRRLYGNVATINPFYSDPRYHDLTATPTPKKLWVAAVDLNAPAGTDPSHPAFYLPAQELLAGNSRGYWVVDPCKSDGNSCETGDECCGGFCRPGTGGKLVCTATVPACAQEFEKCTASADCCNSPAIQCINGRCAAPGPK
jgi:Tol biopolymer transport system component